MMIEVRVVAHHYRDEEPNYDVLHGLLLSAGFARRYPFSPYTRELPGMYTGAAPTIETAERVLKAALDSFASPTSYELFERGPSRFGDAGQPLIPLRTLFGDKGVFGLRAVTEK